MACACNSGWPPRFCCKSSVSIPGAQSCLLLLWHSPVSPRPTPFLRVSLCGVALPALPRTSTTEHSNNPRAIKRFARHYTARPPEQSLFQAINCFDSHLHSFRRCRDRVSLLLPVPGSCSRGDLSWLLQWERRVSCSWHATLKTRPPGHCCSCSCLVRPHCERHYAEVGVFVGCRCHDSRVLFVPLGLLLQRAVFSVWSEACRLLHVREGCSWSLPLQSCSSSGMFHVLYSDTLDYNVKHWACLMGFKSSIMRLGKCFGHVKVLCTFLTKTALVELLWEKQLVALPRKKCTRESWPQMVRDMTETPILA